MRITMVFQPFGLWLIFSRKRLHFEMLQSRVVDIFLGRVLKIFIINEKTFQRTVINNIILLCFLKLLLLYDNFFGYCYIHKLEISFVVKNICINVNKMILHDPLT
jgi:hypothetical protein